MTISPASRLLFPWAAAPSLPHDENAQPVAAAANAALGGLPEWDLTDLYPAPDAPELQADLDTLARACCSLPS